MYVCEVRKRACFIFFYFRDLCGSLHGIFFVYLLGFFYVPPPFFLGPLLEDPEPAAFVVILVAIVLACVSYAQRIIISILYFSFTLPRLSSVLIIFIIW